MQYEETELKGKTFYKVQFPDFWEQACREKNAYFQRVCERVKKHKAFLSQFLPEQDEKRLSLAERDETLLSEKEKLELIWKSELCWFFEEDILITEKQTAYCDKEMEIWICEDCLEICQKMYGWEIKPSDELFSKE